jgi:hypothetical protein
MGYKEGKTYVVLHEPQLFARVLIRRGGGTVVGDERFEFPAQIVALDPVGHVAAVAVHGNQKRTDRRGWRNKPCTSSDSILHVSPRY